ncbi:MAG TPA: restriction endonuclease subunit S [Ilumatobacter sp.]|nr:restriction endonuclease subunit S [Ilumatobacter sp.]
MTLPHNWQILDLTDVAKVYSGGTPRRSAPDNWGGPIPWVTTAEVDGTVINSTVESITEVGLSHSAARIAPAGTLLMAMYGQGKTRGMTSMLGIDAAMNQACAAIEPRPSIDAEYLLVYLQHNYEMIRSLSNSGSQDNLSGRIVKRIPIVVPPLVEQRLIATILRDISSLVSSLEKLIAKKQAIKQGMMQQLLTGRTRLPGFDRPWADVTLGDHVTYLRTVPLSRAQLDGASPLRYLHYGDIHTRAGVTLDAAREPMPRASTILAGRAGRLQRGDLVFADASEDPSGVGKSVEILEVPTDGVVAGLHTIAARFSRPVLADGFKAYLQFIPVFRESLLRRAAGTKVLATTRSTISSITLALPSVDEQSAIAAALRDADAEISALERRLAKARVVKTGMMQQLLTGRIRLPVEVSDG